MESPATLEKLALAVPIVSKLPEGSEPHMSPQYWECVQSIASTLNDRAEFNVEGGLFIGSGGGSWMNFTADIAAQNLIDHAIKTGPLEAVGWLSRVLEKTHSDVRHITEVMGFSVPEGGANIGGVRFTRREEIEQTPAGRYHRDHRFRGGLRFFPGCYATVLIENVQVCGSQVVTEHLSTSQMFSEAQGRITQVVTSITGVLGNGWSLGRSWSEVTDPDISQASIGFGWTEAAAEAPHAFGYSELTQEQVHFATRYIGFLGDFKRRLDIASKRLNLARRRNSLGDKAIEVSIALEALLGDDRFDLTYKIRLRAALLLGGNLEERREISGAVKKLYQLRSDIVHGGKDDVKPEVQEVIDRGVSICARLIQVLVEIGKIPNWDEIEMGAPNQ